MSENRVHPRIRSLLAGRIEFNHRQSTMNCIVRELSTGGAKLEIAQSATLPDEFDLHIPLKEKTLHAKVKWRHGDFIGVEFISAQPVLASDGVGDALRRLEAENAVLRRELAELRAAIVPSNG